MRTGIYVFATTSFPLDGTHTVQQLVTDDRGTKSLVPMAAQTLGKLTLEPGFYVIFTPDDTTPIQPDPRAATFYIELVGDKDRWPRPPKKFTGASEAELVALLPAAKDADFEPS